MTASETVQERPSNALRKNVLGLPSALAMSMAFISPTIGVIFISALIASKAGIASPFTFILGTLGIALMASTLAQFTRRVTSAGTFYKFVCLALGKQAGFVVGILLMFAYALQSPLNTNLFGGFVSDALATDFHLSVPWWLLMIVVVAGVGALAWYSVHTSMRIGMAFLIAEVAVAGILLFLIVFRGGDSGQVPQAFNPGAASQGVGGLGQAFVFIVLAFFGFESSSTVAEEVRNPRKNLPIALIGSVLLTGAWFTFAMYSIIVGYGAKHIDKLAAASAPLHDLAVRYIGPWYGYLIDMAAISALIAVLLAIHTANFRILYSLGRDGLLPLPLGRTHPKHGTPHIAIIVYSIATLVIGLIAGIAWGPLAAFGNLGYLSSLGILPIFIATNIALPVFILKRHRSEFSVFVHIVMPTLSTLTFFAALYLNLVPLPAAPLNVMPVLIIVIIVGAAIWGAVLARRGSRALDRIGDVLFMEADAHPEPRDVDGAAASIGN
ncbi:MAG: APC family permease [Actinomycetota bacterium]|nr:APC family permease [Actinomycetota bacterium]